MTETVPKVTVIVPVYNNESVLRECMNSIIGQSFGDIELICVDDGSSDGSLTLLNEYAKRDERVVVLSQDNRGAGAARNQGLELARGEYVLFLDGDDFFDKKLIEKAYAKTLEHNSDIVVWRAMNYNDTAKRVDSEYNSFRRDLLPAVLPFSYKEVKDNIFRIFTPVVWDKLFRRSLLVAGKLRFQEIHHCNDVYFTWSALMTARRIDILDEALVFYRRDQANDLQAERDKSPLCICKALGMLKQNLIQMGLYKDVEQSFLNRALGHVLYALSMFRTARGTAFFYMELREHFLTNLGLTEKNADYFYDPEYYTQMHKILSMNLMEYLLDQQRTMQKKWDRQRQANAKLGARRDELQESLNKMRQERDRALLDRDKMQKELDKAKAEQADFRASKTFKIAQFLKSLGKKPTNFAS